MRRKILLFGVATLAMLAILGTHMLTSHEAKPSSVPKPLLRRRLTGESIKNLWRKLTTIKVVLPTHPKETVYFYKNGLPTVMGGHKVKQHQMKWYEGSATQYLLVEYYTEEPVHQFIYEKNTETHKWEHKFSKGAEKKSKWTSTSKAKNKFRGSKEQCAVCCEPSVLSLRNETKWVCNIHATESIKKSRKASDHTGRDEKEQLLLAKVRIFCDLFDEVATEVHTNPKVVTKEWTPLPPFSKTQQWSYDDVPEYLRNEPLLDDILVEH